MTTNEYYDLREMIGIKSQVSKKVDDLRAILNDYPNMRYKTLKECLEFLEERSLTFERDIRKYLGVK